MKHGMSHHGYKNHINVHRKHKLIRRYHVTDAAVHDRQAMDELLMRGNTASGVWAGSAYRSEDIEAKLRSKGLNSCIHPKGKRGKPLTEQALKSIRTRSSVRVRVRVEHVFGAQANDMDGTLVRTISLARAKDKIGMKNLVCNIRRLGQLHRLETVPGVKHNRKWARSVPPMPGVGQ
jgi:IS5 family transposase